MLWVPLLVVAVSIILIWVTGAWQFFKWLPPTVPTFHKYTSIHYTYSDIEDYFASPTNYDAIKQFVDEHPDNAEYNFAWALMSEDPVEIVSYIRKAELIDPANPLYPYSLGLTYGGPLGRYDSHRWRTFPFELNADSAMASFDRAEKLEPDNAAIDVARLNFFVEETSDTVLDSYYRRRTPLGKSGRLTDPGREIMRDAIKKPFYRAHETDAVSMGLRLLRDSGHNSYQSRMELITKGAIRRGFDYRAFKFFIKDIGPFTDRKDVEAVADTLLGFEYLSSMMRNDPTAIPMATYDYLSRDVMDILGDLYLVNGLPSVERLVGASVTRSRNWEMFLWRISRGDDYGFTPLYYSSMFIASASQFILLTVICLLIIGIVGISIAGTKDIGADVSHAKAWTAIIAMINPIILLSAFYSISSVGMAIAKLVANIEVATILLVGIILIISQVRLKKKKKRKDYLFPFFLILIGIADIFIVNTYKLAALNFLIPVSVICVPIAVMLGAQLAAHKSERPWAAFFASLARLSSEVIAVLTLILLLSWAIAGPQLTKFMNMDEYYKLAGYGCYRKIPRWSTRWSKNHSHYIDNDGISSQSRVARLERLEEMFGPLQPTENEKGD